MGLIKRDGYTIKGIELPQAYAKISRLYMEHGNIARSYFAISNTRDNINNGNYLDEVMFECYIDKSKPLYEQVYELAKVNNFASWEDDIVVEEVPDPTQPDESTIEEVVEENNTEIIEEVTEETETSTENKEEELLMEEVEIPSGDAEETPMVEETVAEEVVDNTQTEDTNTKYFNNSEVE